MRTRAVLGKRTLPSLSVAAHSTSTARKLSPRSFMRDAQRDSTLESAGLAEGCPALAPRTAGSRFTAACSVRRSDASAFSAPRAARSTAAAATPCLSASSAAAT